MSVSDGMDIYGDSDIRRKTTASMSPSMSDRCERAAGVRCQRPHRPWTWWRTRPQGENIGDPVTATDPEGNTVTYSLDDGDGDSFEIDSSGQIKTKDPLDVATKDTYTVTVTASDDNGKRKHPSK